MNKDTKSGVPLGTPISNEGHAQIGPKPGTQIFPIDFAKDKKPIATYGTKAVQRSKGKGKG